MTEINVWRSSAPQGPLRSPGARAFEQFRTVWDELRRDRIGPTRREIDPFLFRSFLPGMALIDIVTAENEQARYRYRLAGTAHYDVLQRELTGAFADEALPAALGEDVVFVANVVTLRRAPRTSAVTFELDGWPMRCRHQHLPLSDDGEQVTGLLGYYLYEQITLGEPV